MHRMQSGGWPYSKVAWFGLKCRTPRKQEGGGEREGRGREGGYGEREGKDKTCFRATYFSASLVPMLSPFIYTSPAFTIIWQTNNTWERKVIVNANGADSNSQVRE